MNDFPSIPYSENMHGDAEGMTNSDSANKKWGMRKQGRGGEGNGGREHDRKVSAISCALLRLSPLTRGAET